MSWHRTAIIWWRVNVLLLFMSFLILWENLLLKYSVKLWDHIVGVDIRSTSFYKSVLIYKRCGNSCISHLHFEHCWLAIVFTWSSDVTVIGSNDHWFTRELRCTLEHLKAVISWSISGLMAFKCWQTQLSNDPVLKDFSVLSHYVYVSKF